MVSDDKKNVEWIDYKNFAKIPSGETSMYFFEMNYPVNVTYRVCRLYPDKDYKLYIDGNETQVLHTDEHGCTPYFTVQFNSPRDIRLYTEYKEETAPIFKSLLGIGIGVSLLGFALFTFFGADVRHMIVLIMALAISIIIFYEVWVML